MGHSTARPLNRCFQICSISRPTQPADTGYARNQWGSLVRYLDDARFAIDNGAAERAICPLAVGLANWLHAGGDGGLKTASVLLSICASATRHRLDPWSYLREVLDHLAVPSAGADLLPDARAGSRLRA